MPALSYLEKLSQMPLGVEDEQVVVAHISSQPSRLLDQS